MRDQTATIKQENLVLCVKLNGGLYQVHTKSIHVADDMISGRALAVCDLDGEMRLFPEPICSIIMEETPNAD